MAKINLMGSEVVHGFECKPKVLDPNKPMMHFKNIINVCVDKRCRQSIGGKDSVDRLRKIIKELALDRGEDRIKVNKTLCFGACRFRQVANIFANTRSNGGLQHNNIWLKSINLYDEQKIKGLILSLKNSKNLDDFEQIAMKVY